MEKFVRVEKKREENPIMENEVRVTTIGRLHSYINYAASLLKDKGHHSVVLKGMGRAINKTVSLAEILKRRIGGLHQVTEIGSVDITDTWEPKEEGLDTLELTRHVSVITVTLSSDPLDTSAPGYQPPLDEELVKPLQTAEPERRRGAPKRGRGGGRGRGRGRVPMSGNGEHSSGGRGAPSGGRGERGRGGMRGRGRGRFRGRGRVGGRGRGGRGRGGPVDVELDETATGGHEVENHI